MTRKQIYTIRCVHADLIGAYKAYQSLDIHTHDWESHSQTIKDMEDNFLFLESENNHNHPVVSGVMYSCNCDEIIESKCKLLCYSVDESDMPIRDHDGTIIVRKIDENLSGGINYDNAPNNIKKEIKRIVMKQNKKNTTDA